MKKQSYLLIFFFLSLSLLGKSQGTLGIDTAFSPEDLIKKVLLNGDDVKVGNIKYRGHPSALGYFDFENGGKFSLENGLVLSTGAVRSSIGPNSTPARSDTLKRIGDSDLETLCDRTTYDATILEFDFVPLNNKVSFTYIFASEEYLEYSGSKYNDVFAFFISGPAIQGMKNMAIVPNTKNEIVSINTINQFSNQDYFINNNWWKFNGKMMSEFEIDASLDPNLLSSFEYDGMTVALTAETNVVPFKKYHFKIAIADVSDMRYNSAVFLKGGSFAAEIDTTATGVFSQVENMDVERIDFEAIFENKAFDLSEAIIKDNTKVGEEMIMSASKPAEKAKEILTSRGLDALEVVEVTKKIAFPATFESIHFTYDTDALGDESKAALDALAALLQTQPQAVAQLSGHTDATGNAAYNFALSARRIAAIVGYLENKGIDKSQLLLLPKGEQEPIADNTSNAGRAKNRRVEILLIQPKD